MTQPRVERGLPTNRTHVDEDYIFSVGVRRAPLGLIPDYSSLNTYMPFCKLNKKTVVVKEAKLRAPY
jgi:hypothetical protein